jgi:hypothetical protein
MDDGIAVLVTLQVLRMFVVECGVRLPGEMEHDTAERWHWKLHVGG